MKTTNLKTLIINKKSYYKNQPVYKKLKAIIIINNKVNYKSLFKKTLNKINNKKNYTTLNLKIKLVNS